MNNQNFENPSNNISPNNAPDNNVNNNQSNEMNDIEKVIKPSQNKFITTNIDTTNTTINNLNKDKEYNGNEPKVDYSKDPKVLENLNKKNTISITSEGIVFIVIIIILLLFIYVLPTIFDYVRSIQYK